jgi:type IV secretory pathway VirB2 component (pilin)
VHSKVKTLLIVLAAAIPAGAVGIGGGGLPWERPLQLIATSVTGPVAASVGVVGFAICGCMLVFGHDWGDFARRALQVAMAASFVVLATGFMTVLFGIAGATI